MSRKRLARGATRFAQPYKGTSDDDLLAAAAADEDRTDTLGRMYSRNGGFPPGNGFTGVASTSSEDSVTPAHFEGAWETMSVRSRP